MSWSTSSTEHGGAWQTKDCSADYYLLLFLYFSYFACVCCSHTESLFPLRSLRAFHAFAYAISSSRSQITSPKIKDKKNRIYTNIENSLGPLTRTRSTRNAGLLCETKHWMASAGLLTARYSRAHHKKHICYLVYIVLWQFMLDFFSPLVSRKSQNTFTCNNIFWIYVPCSLYLIHVEWTLPFAYWHRTHPSHIYHTLFFIVDGWTPISRRASHIRNTVRRLEPTIDGWCECQYMLSVHFDRHLPFASKVDSDWSLVFQQWRTSQRSSLSHKSFKQ